MPTPTSGTISMLNMRTEITRGSGAISMSEVRTRYGGSGAISFSALYKTEGFVVSCATYSDKFFTGDGWFQVFSFGSVTPNENNGHVQFAANSFLGGAYSTPAGSGADGAFAIYGNTAFSGGVTSGFRGSDVTRVVTANTSRTITGVSETQTLFSYDFPASGTVHCLIKF
jgi:hypothetical protein